MEPEDVRAALAIVTEQLRREFPDYYAHVDRIKATPNREPANYAQSIPYRNGTFIMRECDWCGEDFAARVQKERTQGFRCRFCTRDCAFAFRRWKSRRSA